MKAYIMSGTGDYIPSSIQLPTSRLKALGSNPVDFTNMLTICCTMATHHRIVPVSHIECTIGGYQNIGKGTCHPVSSMAAQKYFPL